MHLPYVNDVPIECIMDAFKIISSGKAEEQSAELGLHIYNIAAYGLSQASQAYFGTPERQPMSAVPLSSEQVAACEGVCTHLQKCADPKEAGYSAPMAADLPSLDLNSIKPILIQIGIQYAIKFLEDLIAKWKNKEN